MSILSKSTDRFAVALRNFRRKLANSNPRQRYKLFTLWFLKAYAVIIIFGIITPNIPIFSYINQPIPEDQSHNHVARASESLLRAQLEDGRYIAVTVSGGGSRAANFSMAVLEQLSKLKILTHVDAISCISGGCLSAAYLSLNWNNPEVWQEGKKRLRFDFFGSWLWRMVNPINHLSMLYTDYDRSDLMASVFDDVLFKNAKFARLNKTPGPSLFINAVTRSHTDFSFTNREFKVSLGSRLDTYPISSAVMASGAFPGVFNNVTLADYLDLYSNQDPIPISYIARTYTHLSDGGPLDNLGLKSITKSIRATADIRDLENSGHQGFCLWILIDSSVDVPPYETYGRSDLRSITDHIFDRNALHAVDALMFYQRRNALAKLRPNGGTHSWSKSPFWEYSQNIKLGGSSWASKCSIWHISFDRLLGFPSQDVPEKLSDGSFEPSNFTKHFYGNKVETHYKLSSIPNQKFPKAGPQTPMEIQKLLYSMAEELVANDETALACVCSWFNKAKINLEFCDRISAPKANQCT